MGRVRAAGESLVRTIESQQWLDTPSYKIEHVVALGFNLLGPGSKPVQDLLHGSWLGHPVHPLLTDLPIGAWTVALVLDGADAVGQLAAGDAAEAAVGLGVVGAAAAALAGVTDWQYTHDNARRTGLIHGALNTAVLGLYGRSWLERRRGRRCRARVLATLGYGLVAVSAYLGGTLVYRHRVGVDHGDHQLEPRDFEPVIAAAELVEGVPRRVEYAGGVAVLVRRGGEVHAFGAHCAHLGGPLWEGWVYRDRVVCPWHGSQFELGTGRNVHGPATAPLARFETRTRDGRVEIRRIPAAPSAVPGSTLAAGGSP